MFRLRRLVNSGPGALPRTVRQPARAALVPTNLLGVAQLQALLEDEVDEHGREASDVEMHAPALPHPGRAGEPPG